MKEARTKYYKKEEIMDRSNRGLTVGDIRAKIEGLSDDTPVLVERVEDVYYEEHGWKTYPVGGYFWYSAIETNEKMLEEIKRRAKGEEPHYPKIVNPRDYMVDLTDEIKSQYTPAFCVFTKKDEPFLLINLHY